MSRLDSFIRRLEAQRACLSLAARLVESVPGPICEVGLGNGRTYDHLRELLPARDIFAFDRRIEAYPGCTPDSAHSFLGDFRDTLPAAPLRLGQRAALVHVDCGTGDEAQSQALAELITPYLLDLLHPAGVLVSDQPLSDGPLRAIPLPNGIAPGRYHMYRPEAGGPQGRGAIPDALTGPSELERLLERFATQRACLNLAVRMIRDRPGPVLELGLGKGRTYDHLRRLLPQREIYACDRSVHAPARLVPDEDHLVLGDFRETLPLMARRLGAPTALIHADIGSTDTAADMRLVAALKPHLRQLVAPGSVLLADRELADAEWSALPLPSGVGLWPYYLYRVGPNHPD